MRMNVAITGASGLIGSAIADHVRESGGTVTRLVRTPQAAGAHDAVYWNPREDDLNATGLAGHDAVINLAGESIFALWTPARRKRIYRSRVHGTRLLATTLADLPQDARPPVLVNASAVGYYGNRPPDEPLTESSPPGDSFMAGVVRDWEAATAPAADAGIRVVLLRFAPVLAPDAFVLKATALSTRLGLGATLGDGRQAFPWVTLDDVIGAAAFALRTPALQGPVNVAAPQRVTNRDFADTAARVLKRPRFFRIPAPALRALGDFGRELLTSAWVVPERLDGADYPWRDPALEPALRRLLDDG